MTEKELREQYPEQIAAVEAAARAAVDNTEAINAAVQADRERLAGIDEVAALFDHDLVHEAKYVNPCTAADLALKAAQAAVKRGSKFLADAKEDFKDSGAGEVNPVPGDPDVETSADDPETRKKIATAQVKAALGRKE